MIFASPAQSAAFDEGYTITYGYAYLRTGDARLSRGQNPPLTNVLIALPLLLRDDIKFPIDQPAWTKGDIFGFTDEFLWKANADPQRIVLLARLPEMMLAMLLACVIYAFTRSHFGSRAAMAALFLCAFDPNILAHGHIVGTDLGLALFMFASCWLLSSALKQSSWRRLIAAGLLAGAALSSKYSAVWLGPLSLLVIMSFPVQNLTFSARLKYLVAFGLAALLVVWATFKFSFGPLVTAGFPVPAPDYWLSLGQVGNRVEASTPAFMAGQISATGFPLYYPFVFLIKTPLPTLIFLFVGSLGLITRRQRTLLVIWLSPLLFLLAAVISHLSLGYRLILPALPFALMLAGWGVDRILSSTRLPKSVTRLLIGAAAVLLPIDVLSIGPDHIAYFNQLVGQHDQAFNYLVDSNLDWGQDLIALRDWITANHIDTIHLAYYGTARPSAYNVNADLLPSFSLNDFGTEVDGFNSNALAPGWYAISATSLQLGLLYTHWDEYAAFRARVPSARVGQSILIYRVDYPSNAIDRTVVLGSTAGDFDSMTLGSSTDRQLIVKWAGDDAAVLDMQGPARYIARGGKPIVGFAPDVHNALLANATRLGSDASGNLRLFEIDARQALGDKLKSWAQSPVMSLEHVLLSLPLRFDVGLTLLGYDLNPVTDQSLDVVTYWRMDRPQTAQRSIFVHVLDRAGQLIGQGDGLNVRLTALEVGDVLAQHMLIAHTGSAAALEIGLYDPSDGQRSMIQLSSGQLIDRVNVDLK